MSANWQVAGYELSVFGRKNDRSKGEFGILPGCEISLHVIYEFGEINEGEEKLNESWEKRETCILYIYIYKYRSQRAKQQKPRQLRAWKSSRTLVAMRSTCRNVYLQFSTIVTMGGWIMEASEHIRTSTSRVNNWKTNVKVSSITKLVALANAPARRAATFLWNMSLTWASSHRLRTQCFNRRATREETRRVAVSIFHGITISKLIRRSKLLAIKHVSPTLI